MVLSLYYDHKLSADVWFSFFPSNITCIGSHGLLQQGNPEYDAKRQALFEYYHPLEFSPTIPLEEKTKLMEEWYVTQPSIVLVAYKPVNDRNGLFHVACELFIIYLNKDMKNL